MRDAGCGIPGGGYGMQDVERVYPASRISYLASRIAHLGTGKRDAEKGDYPASRIAFATGAELRLSQRHEHVPKKPEGDDRRDDVFSENVGQNSVARARRIAARLSRQSRQAPNGRWHLHKFPAGELRRSAPAD